MPKLKLVKPDEKPKERPRNIYSDAFEAAFVEHYGGDPCDVAVKDFVQLARLQRLYKGNLEMDCWALAVKNYFASERMFYTMAHLCTNFAAYKKCAADRFNQPLVEDGTKTNGYKTQAERQTESIRRLREYEAAKCGQTDNSEEHFCIEPDGLPS